VGMKQWFGPSRDDVWRQISEVVGGRFSEAGFVKGDKVEAAHKNWVITLDDLDRLKQLFDLFAALLDALVDLGAADTGPANVRF
jgi:hypothetical protein